MDFPLCMYSVFSKLAFQEVHGCTDRNGFLFFLMKQTEPDCIYNFLFDFEPNRIPFLIINRLETYKRQSNQIRFSSTRNRNPFVCVYSETCKKGGRGSKGVHHLIGFLSKRGVKFERGTSLD